MSNAERGADYLNRTGASKTNMFDNWPEETKYVYTDDDGEGASRRAECLLDHLRQG